MRQSVWTKVTASQYFFLVITQAHESPRPKHIRVNCLIGQKTTIPMVRQGSQLLVHWISGRAASFWCIGLVAGQPVSGALDQRQGNMRRALTRLNSRRCNTIGVFVWKALSRSLSKAPPMLWIAWTYRPPMLWIAWTYRPPMLCIAWTSMPPMLCTAWTYTPPMLCTTWTYANYAMVRKHVVSLSRGFGHTNIIEHDNTFPFHTSWYDHSSSSWPGEAIHA